MLSHYRIQPNNTNKRTKKTSNTNFDNNSHCEPDVERPRLTSNDLKTFSRKSSHEVKPVISKIKLKGGGNIEINEKYLSEIIHNNYLYMDLAIEIIANDKNSKKRYSTRFKRI